MRSHTGQPNRDSQRANVSDTLCTPDTQTSIQAQKLKCASSTSKTPARKAAAREASRPAAYPPRTPACCTKMAAMASSMMTCAARDALRGCRRARAAWVQQLTAPCERFTVSILFAAPAPPSCAAHLPLAHNNTTVRVWGRGVCVHGKTHLSRGVGLA